MKIKYIDGKQLKNMVVRGCQVLERNKKFVDDLNVFPVPDGDTGTNMSLTMNSAKDEVESVVNGNVEAVAKALANGSLMGARGNSGVILSQIFRGFSKACKGKETLDVGDFAKALHMASDTAYGAVMKPIEGTILTIIRSVSERAMEIGEIEEDICRMLEMVIDHGEEVLSKTPDMLKVLKEAGVVDAGGKGLIFILNGFYEALTGKIIIEETTKREKKSNLKIHGDKSIQFGYCTEFIIKSTNANVENLKKKIMNMGDSMLVVGDENLVKVHIHTNNPGNVIEEGLKLGQLVDVKIDNMRYQHENRLEKKDLKKYGIVAVAMGEGIENIFKDINVDKVIAGGQTMNPSTQDIKEALDSINAENIFILPNNSNIILAANQAKALSEKNVIVIPTKTIPQGIGAVVAYNPENEVDVNEKNMNLAMKDIKTGQITYSVRETTFKDIDIKKGDILGISDGEIVTVGSEIENESHKLLKNIVDEDSEIITLFYGSDIEKERADKLAEEIEEEFEDCDVEVYYGGQPLYYYIFSVE
ncbi:DAK2 domain-containing protein [Anaeromicrobium sediminis]|uniref:Dihydroxyacetone kinase n=1 Tax=Anaeromicrobium sediminis TaxID=1478221 RepID=A0A267MHD1_9FIRM|nr:DAK2 domain-containing protein [Anaeromicrobium sediminis]PAB58877.1 dihydroxyacetone kinase [Anaeromicrobium sediminis]